MTPDWSTKRAEAVGMVKKGRHKARTSLADESGEGAQSETSTRHPGEQATEWDLGPHLHLEG